MTALYARPAARRLLLLPLLLAALPLHGAAATPPALRSAVSRFAALAPIRPARQLTQASTSAIFSGGERLTTTSGAVIDLAYSSAPAVGDLDHDGLLDLLLDTGDGSVQHYEQAAPNGLQFVDHGLITTDGSTALNVMGGASPTLTDLDGDGLLDLLVGSFDPVVRRFRQAAPNSSVFAYQGLLSHTSTGYQVLPGPGTAPAVVDLNGNGQLDILVGRADGDIARYELNSPSTHGVVSLSRLTTNGSTVLDVGSYSAPPLRTSTATACSTCCWAMRPAGCCASSRRCRAAASSPRGVPSAPMGRSPSVRAAASTPCSATPTTTATPTCCWAPPRASCSTTSWACPRSSCC